MTQEGDWITDKWDARRGRGFTIKLDKIYEQGKSKFQSYLMAKTCFGNTLFLDDVMMNEQKFTDNYHEMLTHLALSVHPSPTNVLIIGGGDGGIVTQVARSKEVKHIDWCEIDGQVIELGKKYYPEYDSGRNDPRTNTVVDDGAKFVSDKNGKYQVILIDSSDPWGPAEVLFSQQFYENMKNALADDGIIVSQFESMYYDLDFIAEKFKMLRKVFPIVKYAHVDVASYPSGKIGFAVCSKRFDPVNDLKAEVLEGKYYNRDMHLASFVLPTEQRDAIYGEKK